MLPPEEAMKQLAYQMVGVVNYLGFENAKTKIAVTKDESASMEQWEIGVHKIASTGSVATKENKNMTLIQPIELEVLQLGGQRFYGPNQYPSITTVLDADPEKQEGLRGWALYEKKRHLASLLEIETRAVTDELYAQYQHEQPELHKQAVADAELYMKDYVEYAKDRGNKFHVLCQQYLIKKFQLNHPLFPNLEAPIVIDKGTPEGILFDDVKIHLDKIDNIVGIEIPVISNSLRVAGTADIIGRYEGKPSILDLKGSTKAPKPYKRNDWFKQMCFYGVGGEETYTLSKAFGEPVEQLVVICGREDAIGNTRKDKVYKSSIDEQHTNLVRSLLTYRDIQAQSMQQIQEGAPW